MLLNKQQPTLVPSLNQTLSSKYTVASASKRHRPVDASAEAAGGAKDGADVEEGNQNALGRSSSSVSLSGGVGGERGSGGGVADGKVVRKRMKKASSNPHLFDMAEGGGGAVPSSDGGSGGGGVAGGLMDSRYLVPRPTARLADLAGLDSIVGQVRELVFYPVQFPQLYSHLGVRPPCGLLLHGPSGCGKTSLAVAIAGELNLPFFKVRY